MEHNPRGYVNTVIQVEPTDCIPEDATVRHYDELAGEAKHDFPSFTENDGAETIIRDDAANDFTDGEVVVYTRYYRVQVS